MHKPIIYTHLNKPPNPGLNDVWWNQDEKVWQAFDGTNWTVEQRTPHGVIVKTHRLTRPTEPVTAQDRQVYRRRILAESQPTQRAAAERMVGDMPYPQSKPVYRRFEFDELGRFWLEAYSQQSDSGTLWIRLDPRTSHAVAVQLPPRFRAFAFTANFVYGVWRDSDDVEQVQVFALEQVNRGPG